MSDPQKQNDSKSLTDNSAKDANLHDRLDDLDAKLRDVAKEDETASSSPQGAAMGLAMRMGIEFVVAVLIGSAIGWQLDQWFGTTPFLLFIFLVFGFAAGTLNIIRSGRRIEELKRNKE